MLFESWDNDAFGKPNPSYSSQLSSPSIRAESFKSGIAESWNSGRMDSPIFTLERLKWRATAGTESVHIVSLATSKNVLNILSDRLLTNWDLVSETYSTVLLSRSSKIVLRHIWSSPSKPYHILIAALGGVLFYLNESTKKPTTIKTANVDIESVSWLPHQHHEPDLVLLGSDCGAIYVLDLSLKEKALRKIHQLPEMSPIHGIEVEIFTDPSGVSRYLTMCTTKTRLYEYIGTSLEAAFTDEASPFIELFGNVEAASSLQFYREDGRARTVAWLTQCGLYHGKLQLDGRHEASTTAITDYHLLPYPTNSQSDLVDGPVGLAVTRFHFLLLFTHRLVCFNQLNQNIVYDVHLPENGGPLTSMVRDPQLGSVFIYSPLQLHEVIIDQEDRYVWHHYLDQKDFGSALEFASTPAQRNQVLCAHGDYLFAKGEYKLAAAIYSQSQRPFESIALMFLNEERARDALKDFLRRRLDSVPSSSLTQRTMICTWLTEIYLDQLNMLRDSFNDDAFEDLITEFVDFISVYRDALDRTTTFDLISSHGRTEELLQYAEIIGAHDWVVLYSIEQQRYSTALDLIVAHCESNPHIMQLLYRIAPQLVQHEPDLAIDAFIKLSSSLDGVRLLPALHRCEVATLGETISPSLRYLQHIVQSGDRNPILHNYFVALMVKLPEESAMLEYLQDQVADPVFDMKFALRLCHQESKIRCCVRIYEMMSLYLEAARLALTIDPQLAKQVALSLSTNTSVPASDRKAIWLSIGRHLLNERIGNGGTLPEAIALIKECSPHIQVEDMLPYFPDNLKIGEFRSDIVACLRQYNERLKALHQEQEALSSAATALKGDMQMLRNRTAHVKHDQTCDFCKMSIFSSRFLVFPCNHMFHATCAQEEFDRMQELIGDRKRTIFESESEDDDEVGDDQSLVKNAALACVFCSTEMILTIDTPLPIDESNSFDL